MSEKKRWSAEEYQKGLSGYPFGSGLAFQAGQIQRELDLVNKRICATAIPNAEPFTLPTQDTRSPQQKAADAEQYTRKLIARCGTLFLMMIVIGSSIYWLDGSVRTWTIVGSLISYPVTAYLFRGPLYRLAKLLSLGLLIGLISFGIYSGYKIVSELCLDAFPCSSTSQKR